MSSSGEKTPPPVWELSLEPSVYMSTASRSLSAVWQVGPGVGDREFCLVLQWR